MFSPGFSLTRHFYRGSLKGLRPFKTYPPPLLKKERGIKGVRITINYYTSF